MQKYLRVIHLPSNQVLLEAPTSECFEIRQFLFFPLQYAHFKILKSTGKKHFGPRLGVFGNVQVELKNTTRLDKKLFKVILPSPFGLFLRSKCFLVKRDPELAFEQYSHDPAQNDLSIIESEIFARAGDVKSLERIKFLIKEKMIIIDERNDRKSILLKSKSDGRFFQLLVEGESLEKPETMLLCQITHQQWNYFYLEQRESRRLGKQTFNPKEYLDSLEEDTAKRPCEVEGCQALAVKFSSLCKAHHFEAVMGHLPN